MSDTNDGALASVPIRPLSKGMYDDRISQLMDPGGATDITGYDVTPYGLATSSGLAMIHSTNSLRNNFMISGEYVTDIDAFAQNDGTNLIFAITNKFIYFSLDSQTWTPVRYSASFSSWTYSALTGKYNAGTSNIADGYAVGMYLRIPISGGYAVSRITEVGNNYFRVADTIAYTTGTLSVHVLLEPEHPFIVQYARSPAFVLITDGKNRMLKLMGSYVLFFNPTTVDYDDPANPVEIAAPWITARTVAFVAGRFIVGGPSDGDGRTRVRWSSMSDPSLFDPTDYAEFPASQGSITRITNVEDYVVVFTEDLLTIGQPYGFDAPLTSPWLWRPIAGAGAAPIGPRAYCQIPGGVAFLGIDDVYTFTPLKRTDKGDFIIESLKCPVRRRFTSSSINAQRQRFSMRYDPSQQRVLISVPTVTAGSYNEQFFWSLVTNEWSRRGTPQFVFTAFCYLVAKATETWSSTTKQWNTATGSWISLSSGAATVFFMYADSNGYLYSASRSTTSDETPLGDRSPITRIYETCDYDMGLPDEMKSVRKFALRLRRDPGCLPDAMAFTLEGSTDKGRTWKPLPDLVVAYDEDEAEVHFALRGNLVRFRVTTSTLIGPFTLEELTFRVRTSGRQIIRND